MSTETASPPLAARGAAAYSGGTALAAPAGTTFSLAPQNFEQALVFANYLAESGLVPRDYEHNPGKCLIAMQWGAELGLQPLQAIQNIAVINGRPSLWGDVMLALVRASPLCEYVAETITGAGEDMKAICRVKRRGEPEQVREFTVTDAQTAKLWTKDGPWKQYPKRMLQMRARAWALRDVFTDLLKGLHMAEEAWDMPAKDMGPVQYAGAPEFQAGAEAGAPPAPTPAPTTAPPPPPASSALPALSDKDFQDKLPTWRGMIAAGTKTPDRMIAFLRTKYTLTDAQEKAIRKHPYSNGDATDATPKDKPPVKVTYAEVIGKMNDAARDKNRDAFDTAATLIGAIEDEQQRVEATQHYEALLEEFA
jgi:hypothetical protein